MDLLLGKGANATYSHPDLLKGSTPLMNEISQRKSLTVISLLVRARGITPAAIQLAKKRGMAHALATGTEITALLKIMADRIMSFVLWVIGCVNAIGGVLNAIFEFFGIRGRVEIPQFFSVRYYTSVTCSANS